MKLRRLAIRRLPGIPEPGFAIDRFGDGINVISGPNASGKTSVPRAVRTALYPGEAAGQSVHIEAAFASEDGTFEASRTGGTVTWARDGRRIEAPLLPDHRFVPCYTLHLEDLLASDGKTDAEIARHVARELAGGYDLDGARKSCRFSVPAQIGRREGNELDTAAATLRKVQYQQRELHRKEEQLAALERERREAEEAGREAALLDRALELLERRRNRIGLERRREAHPPALSRILGDEAEKLSVLRKERQDVEANRARIEAEVRSAERTLEETGLADSDLDQSSVMEFRVRLGRLQEFEEGHVERERANVRKATGERDRAIAGLGGEPGRVAKLDPDSIRSAEEALEESRRLAAELRGIDAELSRLPEPEETEASANPDLGPERLREARHELLRWLSASLPPRINVLRLIALAVLIASAAAGGVAAGLIVHPAGFGLLLAAFLAAGWLLFRRDAGFPQRQESERRFRALRVERPVSWDAERVETRLFELDSELVEAWRHAEQLRRRREAESRREGVGASLGRERAALATLARNVNFEPEALDAAFHRWLRLTEQYDRADAELLESRRQLAARERQASGLRAAITAFLAEHGEAPEYGRADGAVADGEPAAGRESIETGVLLHRFDHLAERVRRRDEAWREIDAAKEHLKRLASDLEAGEAAMTGLFHGAGLEPHEEAELLRRLELLPEWRDLEKQLGEARVLENHLREELATRPDLLARVDEDADVALRERRDLLREQEARGSELAQEITKIQTLAEQTAKGRELEDARARHQRAEDALRRRYDEAMLAGAGAFLLDQVESEHVRTSRPAVLLRAEDWFARFTRHQFQLAIDSGDSAGFGARETATDEWRALSELSSGTRMQLLLAVRVAFALEAEKGRSALPLFLDEALTTADPERFRAAAESLQRFAEEDGRQIFYLTAQPEEIRYWAAAKPVLIELAEARRAGRTVAHPAELELPPAPDEPPRPDGELPEAYAMRIGVEPVRPWASASALHLFHLLRDDLELLWRLLRRQIGHLGPLASLIASGEAKLILSEDEQSALKLRYTGAEAWIEAWRTGRGRPVDREALAASGAVSGDFMERVSMLAENLDGDARDLLNALEAGKVRFFRADKRLQLEEWFREHGHLVDAAPLAEPALIRRVAAALSAHGMPSEGAFEEAARLARALAAGVPS